MATELNFYVSKTIELKGIEKLHCLHGNWSSIVHIAHFSQTNSSLLTERIDYIIQQLLRKHPRLRSRIRIVRSLSTSIYHPQTLKPYVNEQHLLDLFEYDEELFSQMNILTNFYSFYQGNENWMKIVEDISNRNPYNQTLTCIFPLFHFMIILNTNSNENCHLILLTNHSISDGQSGYIILHDYLTLATQNQSIQWKINQDITPNLLDLTEKPYKFIYPLISKLINFVYNYHIGHFQHKLPIKSFLLNPEHSDNNKQYPYIQPMRTHFLFTSCSKDHYEQLRQVCHERNLTLHGPLFACLVLAIQYSFFLPSIPKSDTLTNIDIEINYNMRNRSSSNIDLNEIVGCYVAANCIDLSNISLTTAFWSLADYCYKETHKKLLNNEIPLNIYGFSDIINDKKHFFDLIGKSSDGCLSEMNYSNLGKYSYDINQYKNVNLDGIHIINNNSIYYSSLTLYLTCVKQIDISLAHRLENLNQAKEFLYLYKYLIELSTQIHMNITIEDIFEILNKEFHLTY